MPELALLRAARKYGVLIAAETTLPNIVDYRSIAQRVSVARW